MNELPSLSGLCLRKIGIKKWDTDVFDLLIKKTNQNGDFQLEKFNQMTAENLMAYLYNDCSIAKILILPPLLKLLKCYENGKNQTI